MQVSSDNFIKAQTLLTIALTFFVAVAGWGVKRFVCLVDKLEAAVEGLHGRIAVLEVRLGILPDERKQPR